MMSPFRKSNLYNSALGYFVKPLTKPVLKKYFMAPFYGWGSTASRLEPLWLVSSGASLTSRGKGASLALVANPFSDGVTIKMSYGVDVLHRPASHSIISYLVGYN